MNKVYQRILINIIITSAVLFAGFKYFPQNIFASEYLVLSAIYLISVIVNLVLATEFKTHNRWLYKGHARQRATEILIPPSLFSKIRLCLSEDKLNVSRSTKELKRIVSAYNRKIKLPQTLPVLIFATAVFLSIGLLTQNLLATINDQLPLKHAYGLIAYYLAFSVVGALLSMSSLHMYKILKSQVSDNIEKAYDLFEIPTPPSENSWRLDYRNLLATLSFSMIPLLALEAYTFNVVINQKRAVFSLEETQNNLEESVNELSSKLMYADDENQELNSQMSGMKDNLELVRLQLDKAKKDLTAKVSSLSQQESRLERLKKSQDKLQGQLSSIMLDKQKAIEELKKFRKEKSSLAVERSELNDDVNALKSKLANLKNALASKQKEVSSTKQKLTTKDKELTTLKKKHSKPLLQKYKWPKAVELKNNRLILSADSIFIGKSERISDKGNALLKSLVANLNRAYKAQKNISLLFNVHTDILPPQENTFVNNRELTAAQAVTLGAKMAELGLNKQLIVTAGLGADFERDARIMPDALKRNRRVEIILLESVKLDIFP